MTNKAGTTPLRRRLIRAARRRRRVVVAVLVGLSVISGLSAVAPTSAASRSLVVAARDIPAGVQISVADLTTRKFPVALVPGGVVTDLNMAVDRRAAGPIRAGEPVTDARLVGPSMLRGLGDQVAVSIRLADPDSAWLIRPGDRVDLVAGLADPVGQPIGSTSEPTISRRSGLVATAVLVLAVPVHSENSLTGNTSGSLAASLIVALPHIAAIQLATAGPLSLVLRPEIGATSTPPNDDKRDTAVQIR